MLGLRPDLITSSTRVAGSDEPRAFQNPEDEKVAQIARDVIRKLENQPHVLPSVTYLQRPEVQAEVLKQVVAAYRPAQLELEGVTAQPDFAAVIAKTSELVVQQTIDIPRIVVLPKGEVKAGFRPFKLELEGLRYQAPSDELWIQHLRTNQLEVIGAR